MSDDDDSFNDDEYDDYSEDGDDTDLQDVKSKLTLQKRMQPFDSFNSSAIHALIQTEVQSLLGNLKSRQSGTEQSISDPDSALLLYIANNFDTQATLEAYSGNADLALTNAGLPSSDSPVEELDDKIVECGACLEDFPAEETQCLWCGHRFCKDCWNQYFVSFVKRRGAKGKAVMGCLEAGCKAAITRKQMVNWNIPPAVIAKVDDYLVRDFVQANKKVWKWCPGLNCECAVRLQDTSLLEKPTCTVACSQNHRFCFNCGLEDHSPVNCTLLENWIEKCSGESENAQWIIANTRKCPKCKTRIEKNHGCNHMICTTCEHEFCWVCMGDWKEHGAITGGFYKCNRYKKKREMMAGPKTAEDENDLYLHFFNRYANHDASRRFAQKNRKELVRKMEFLQQQNPNLTWQDVQFLREAGETVERCRQILKYTYVFGYFLNTQKGKHQELELFEYLQEQLERNTEYLHEMTEQHVTLKDRTVISNYTGITEKFAKNLLDGIQNGLTQR